MAKQQIQSDHDLLITLNTKVDILNSAVNKMNDGLSERIGKFELRLKQVEDSHAGIDTRQEVENIRSNREIIKDLEKRWKVVMGLLTPVYIALIGLIVDLIRNFFKR